MPAHVDDLRIVPLGGLGEVGMNCLALEQGQDIVVIDCGVTFPSDSLGVDLLHPRFDWLLEHRARVRGVVLTHGHEDHIGGLPYLLDDLDVPVFGPRHALELARARLDEWRFDIDALELVETRPGEPFDVGSFGFEPIRVTHSIADATALAIDTSAGLVIHTGDFKLDAAPADGELTDEARLAELGREGVRLLLSDSTNVDSPGTSASEGAVGEELGRLVSEAKARVVVGIFASNVQRLMHLGDIALRTKRKLCLLGRSALNHVRVATAVERLRWPSDLLVSPEIAAAMPRRDVLVVATGTQAEPLAALARLAQGVHPKLRLEEGDRVVFSSRIIPGNDRAVFDLYASFLRQGIEVVSRATNPRVHASGHAHRDELRRMLELVRPASFLPVHGTLHHLVRHAELARAQGVEDVLVAENGQVVGLGRSSPLTKLERVPAGRVAVFDGDPIPEEVLGERAQLARAGVVALSVVLGRSGRLAAPPELRCLGVLGPLDRDVLVRASRAVERALDDARGATGEALDNVLRLAARRVIESHTGLRPVVLVSVIRSDAA